MEDSKNKNDELKQKVGIIIKKVTSNFMNSK
jgi:hypothetical protein